MRWIPISPAKATLVLLFKAAKRRVPEQTDDIAELQNARIVSATRELNQIADDVREAQATPEVLHSTVPPEPLRSDERRESLGRRRGDH